MTNNPQLPKINSNINKHGRSVNFELSGTASQVFSYRLSVYEMIDNRNFFRNFDFTVNAISQDAPFFQEPVTFEEKSILFKSTKTWNCLL